MWGILQVTPKVSRLPRVLASLKPAWCRLRVLQHKHNKEGLVQDPQHLVLMLWGWGVT